MRAHAAGSEHGNLVEGGETRQAVTSLFSRLLCLSSVFLTRSARQGVVKGMAWTGDNRHRGTFLPSPVRAAQCAYLRESNERGPKKAFEANVSNEHNEPGEACRTPCASYSGLGGSAFCLSSPTRCVG